MSNNRKNTFYIASIEETNVSNEKQEAALEDFFNKKKLERQKASETNSRGSYRPTPSSEPKTPIVYPEKSLILLIRIFFLATAT